MARLGLAYIHLTNPVDGFDEWRISRGALGVGRRLSATTRRWRWTYTAPDRQIM